MKLLFRIFLYSMLCIFLYACSTNKTTTTTTKTDPIKKTEPEKKPISQDDEFINIKLPEVKHEFRAAWVASVANINWPSRNNLSTEEQKSEAINLLNYLQENNFNAVIFQVRPSADALYQSKLEPWSYFLTGETGKAPNPYYDPLQFWISEAHKRGLQLHVWLNPFRAHHSSGGNLTSASLAKKSSENVIKLKNGMYWFDPADPKTQDHVSAVVEDIVSRYEIDGLHFDDYFYPYASYNSGVDFPDAKSWKIYQNSGGTLSKSDWRRANVNKFVERIYREIKSKKPKVLFGISPFGIWKPGYPSQIKGSSQYDELYADAKLWLNQGWVDYFSPQLYWPIDAPAQSFPVLLNWWQSENTKNRHLWPGLNTVEIKVKDKPSEITKQIEISRNILGKDAGEIHWSIAGLIKNPAMRDALKSSVYKDKALIPKSPWIKTEDLKKPIISYTKSSGDAILNWTESNATNIFQWLIFLKYGESWDIQFYPQSATHQSVPMVKNGKTLTLVSIKALDNLSNESPATTIRIK